MVSNFYKSSDKSVYLYRFVFRFVREWEGEREGEKGRERIFLTEWGGLTTFVANDTTQ